MNQSATTRILDAATNRATEGLRVVEDFARFVLDDSHLTKLSKTLRHDLAATCDSISGPDRLASRETQQDVGTTITTSAESERTSPWQVCVASLERTKQSLRSLEEYSKIDAPQLAQNFESLRYRLYTVERALGITQDSHVRLCDCQLCVLLDGQGSIDNFRKLAQEIIAAGVPMIQLRQKGLSDRELTEQTSLQVRLLRQLANDSELIIIVNDRPDIAASASADGVHLGQDDLSVKDARAILGPQKLIGVSTHNLQQARTAVLDGANYLGAGPTFPSTTKSFDEFPGLDFLKQVAEEISLPTFAIGGINAENLQEVLSAGVTRIAVSGAITSAAEPKAATSELLNQLKQPTAPTDG